MKKILGNRFVQWGCLFVLACGSALLTHALLAGGDADSLTATKAITDSNAGYSLPIALLSDQVMPEYSDPALSAGNRSAKPAMLQAVEPVPTPPAPAVPPKPAIQPLSARIVEYHMNVELDAEGKLLRGASSISWTHPGAKPVQELYLHLYPNAFASKKTTFMQESGGRLRDDEQKEGSFGSMKISSIKTLDGQDLLERASYIQPDDGNVEDKTLMKLILPAPVLPGQKITIQTSFTVQLPTVFARMGYAGDFVMAGQWFPKLAVYEKAGTRGRTEEGWNLHQYHGNSEFYADFGIYDVRIKVPSHYIVAATGFQAKPAADDGKTKTYSFYADDVHDFAWAASPHFIYHEEPFSTPHVPGVRIKLYLDPKHEHLKGRYMAAAKKSLARYSEWYGRYPYSTLSIVVPPADGNGAGGMEYPTLVTAWGAADENPGLELERVVVHEIGHQYWYGMVASNEFEEAWLDEGFTSYAEDKLMELEYGVKPNLLVESSYMTNPAPLRLHSWGYDGHQQYAENVYTRAKLVLTAMEKQVGQDTMNRILRTYFQRWKFKHPTTSDFQKVVQDVTKTDWQPFFEQYVYGSMMTDYAVGGIQVDKAVENGQTTYINRVHLRRLGGVQENVPVRFQFADGKTVDNVWEGRDSEVVMKFTHSAPLEWVMIDPEFSMVLENKRINSFMKAEVDSQLSIRWNVGVTRLLETVAGWLAW